MEFLRTKRVSTGLDLAPLIDVVFQLLIFFMLASSFTNLALKLTLPTAISREQVDPDQLVVSIERNGTILVNHSPVKLENLKDVLQARLQSQADKRITFRGDQDMRYQLFVQVMDIAKQAGARQLNIAHQEAGDER
jgi:biopolymer transport protein ExbD